MASPKHWPKPPRWSEDFPCPTSVTLYLSGLACRRYNKSFVMPEEPDWKKIWKDYRILKKND